MTKHFQITRINTALYTHRITTWIKNQVSDANRAGVVLGISGGVDSALAARLSQVAQVDTHLIMMPYGDDMKNSQTYDRAMALIQSFGFKYTTKDIKPAVDALAMEGAEGLALANLRPRMRMAYLYQYAQLHHLLVMGTGNFSEITVGYSTKWGDSACDINPLAMLTKTEVYVLAEFLGVPYSIIKAAPSAGLWAGQTDEAELGMSYAQLDDFVLKGTSGDPAVDEKIRQRGLMSAHKNNPTPIFMG